MPRNFWIDLEKLIKSITVFFPQSFNILISNWEIDFITHCVTTQSTRLCMFIAIPDYRKRQIVDFIDLYW